MSQDRYLQQYLKSKVKDQKILIGILRNELQEQRFRNLRMRLDLQVLTEYPSGKAADKIRHRYNVKRAIGVEMMDHSSN